MNQEEFKELENIVRISRIPEWKDAKKKAAAYGIGSIAVVVGCMAGCIGLNEPLFIIPITGGLFYAESKLRDYELARKEIKAMGYEAGPKKETKAMGCEASQNN